MDFWIGETFSYLGEALLFVERAKATGLPVMVTMSFEKLPAHAYEGDPPGDCARSLSGCRRRHRGGQLPERPGPAAADRAGDARSGGRLRGLAARGVRHQRRTPGLHLTDGAFPYALDPLQVTRHEMGEFARQANEAGIQYIGSCCGSVAGHVRAMAKVLGKLPESERDWRSTGKAMSAYEYYDHAETETE